ncbi:MAG: asparagine synthase (glutamine-hydrolyzing), partial [Candidatus Cloacimonetes bacterium 4572_65]
MCGISGIFNYKKSIRPLDKIVAMNNKIRHRGPDDEGYFLIDTAGEKFYSGLDSTQEIKAQHKQINSAVSGTLAFGFRRLAIIDLSSAGHQPMQDNSSRYTIIFNGEIYNYRELREDLLKKGYNFNTETDTEVVLNMYSEYGDSCFKLFNGMWAIAIWDSLEEVLTLSRDRWGIKPLCYFQDKEKIVFGSEEKQIKAYGITTTPNYDMIYRYLKMGSMVRYGEETFYNEIKVIKPGHLMKIKGGNISIEKFYDMDIANFETYKGSFESACEEYKELFTESVSLRMRSDVEVGSCLSGGLDSSAIVCSATKERTKLKTFSAYFTLSQAYDERKWMKIVNEKTGSKAHFINPKGSDVERDFRKITYFHDSPVIGSSPVTQYYVMKKAKESGVTVLLDGQGSDEITAGYNHAFYRYYADLIKQRKFEQLFSEFPEYLSKQQKGSPISKIAKVLFTLIAKESSLYNYEVKNYEVDVMKDGYYRGILAEVEDIKCGKLSNFQYNLLNNIFMQSLLHFEDRNSMAFSIESRVPFLDYKLVEFAYSLPSEYKIKGATGKRVHRIGLSDVVPEEIYNRK